ncbi:FtsQ-type POTRA domain-containing protein [Microbacterium sp. QXD-8]|uniref:FtsQ-type POTRA domain-containing protein n=1 Tax=Microbacterium psychrotolerans TaxID=3068321 RepID=A0ABU0Z216_9MICO|nr:FtsQ-type POTRA domain-containing protein [Microbacterium sp. QXD-8]MDQ7878043.1 FtsQ-type POTRA domain-containing protein [Microbacterium sp. QXD-8]
MRRPSPLPQSPVASRGAADAATPSSRRARRRDEATTVITDPVESVEAPLTERDDTTAPIIPLALPPVRPEPGSVAQTPSAGTDAGDVGFREVWKASRARRKALRAEIRRFTVRQRRRRAIWLGAAASVLLLALGTLGAAYSPLFGVEKISVVGAQQVSPDAIADALAGQLGTPLPLIDESAVKAELVAFPLIETYALEARPPHELVVRIVERTPIGLIETRAGYTLVDAAGVALSTTATPSPGTPLLTITGGVDSDAFAAAGQVMRSLPDDIRAQVTEVAASTPDDVTLTLGGSNAQIVWGSADQSGKKAMVLATAMAARPPADVLSYDVSSPDAIVIR